MKIIVPIRFIESRILDFLKEIGKGSCRSMGVDVKG